MNYGWSRPQIAHAEAQGSAAAELGDLPGWNLADLYDGIADLIAGLEQTHRPPLTSQECRCCQAGDAAPDDDRAAGIRSGGCGSCASCFAHAESSFLGRADSGAT